MNQREYSPPRFQIGQMVYVPQADAYNRKDVPCPVCYGKRSVVVILGNDEHQPMQCDYCANGHKGTTGTISVYAARSYLIEGAVTGLRQDSFDGWKIQVGHSEYRECDIYTDRDLAEARRAELLVEAEAQAQSNFESRFKDARKSKGWTVGYHKREIASLERQIEWHRAKLTAVKVDAIMADVDATIAALVAGAQEGKDGS